MSHQTWIYDPEKKSSSGEKVKLWSFTPLEFKGSIHLDVKIPSWIFFNSHIILIKVIWGHYWKINIAYTLKLNLYVRIQIKSDLSMHCQKELSVSIIDIYYICDV